MHEPWWKDWFAPGGLVLMISLIGALLRLLWTSHDVVNAVKVKLPDQISKTKTDLTKSIDDLAKDHLELRGEVHDMRHEVSDQGKTVVRLEERTRTKE